MANHVHACLSRGGLVSWGCYLICGSALTVLSPAICMVSHVHTFLSLGGVSRGCYLIYRSALTVLCPAICMVSHGHTLFSWGGDAI